MNLHEHQAKDLLEPFGIPIAKRTVVYSVDEIREAVRHLSPPLVVKAQIHAGGRGMSGGIKIVQNIEQAVSAAGAMFGRDLVTAQTGTNARTIRRLLISEALDIDRELYTGILLDRERRQLVLMVSTDGGVEIEKIAHEHPERIYKEYIDTVPGLAPFQCRRLAFSLGLSGPLAGSACQFFSAIYQAFIKYDCSLIEINPTIITPDNKLYALDAKMAIDDNALCRHPEMAALRDLNEEEPLEIEAEKFHLNYIKLDGSVGCMVNGAGLAMATMDLIQLAGARPANFLDVGGGASAETIENGFKILLSDPQVKVVLVNIFGGIVRCDRVAAGIIAAAFKMELKMPVVVRLAGTNALQASRLLAESGMNLNVAMTLDDAAVKVMQCLSSSGAV
jgi:succinyl-CoA synthetase beta subunit